jgi:hypothetical protein
VQEFLESTVDPPAEATFEYGFRSQHSWIGHSPVEAEREITYAECSCIISLRNMSTKMLLKEKTQPSKAKTKA